ncbi:hypothetical protein B5X24_HaOG211916 [Helicoverpa armigera]|uniref:Uncharacterized protein n=1 Tax=Helicoverpa armigera TaxID=29058 RepID=A0A2W1BH30_HELAM|nr:hypothetical protein B5X24_HaOG211916 [Helicoverpa armigera]
MAHPSFIGVFSEIKIDNDSGLFKVLIALEVFAEAGFILGDITKAKCIFCSFTLIGYAKKTNSAKSCGNGKVLLAEAGKHYVTGATSGSLNAPTEDDLAFIISLHYTASQQNFRKDEI